MAHLPAGYFDDEKAPKYVTEHGIPFQVALHIVHIEEDLAEDEKLKKRGELIEKIKNNELTILEETLRFDNTDVAKKVLYIFYKKNWSELPKCFQPIFDFNRNDEQT